MIAERVQEDHLAFATALGQLADAGQHGTVHATVAIAVGGRRLDIRVQAFQAVASALATGLVVDPGDP